MARFKTRARTVDMLGRQQIAGVPTAISELFKNAHDAYATYAIVDYFRSDNLFVLRDDGIGMTEADYEERWLVLGTESKAGLGGALAPPLVRPGYARRPVLGEKGIGRLAIAAIGPQVLMLSRPVRDDALGDLLVSFVHWGLFELPGVNLEEVEIPTVTLSGGQLPGPEDITTLVDWASENLGHLAKDSDVTLVTRIQDDLRTFRGIDPTRLAETLGSPGLLDGPGTHFYIRPATKLLAEDLEDEAAATPLRKMLVGFANTMTPEHSIPVLKAAFRDHFTEDASRDVIDEAEFFTPDEFRAADHHIRGTFDGLGTFHGTVSVYGHEPQEYTLAGPPTRGSPTKCGPFVFNLAYVQGNRRDSLLDPEMWQQISSKLDLYGGLYIYRDGVRVLPYGDSDFDFLDVEVRRAKSADDAFFSYRRMFGVIELTRHGNAELREKAGREGFAENDAYRQFRKILMQFLRQVAFDYFRKAGTLSDRFWSQKVELERLDKARQRRGKSTTSRRRSLSQQLDGFLQRVENGQPAIEVADLVSRFEGQVAAAVACESPSVAVSQLLEAEASVRKALRSVAAEYEIARPRGLGLTKAQLRQWGYYENQRAQLAEEVLRPALEVVEAQFREATSSHGLAVERRLRFDTAISTAAEVSRDVVRASRKDLDALSKDTDKRARRMALDSAADVEATTQSVLGKANALDLNELTDAGFVAARSDLEETLASVAASHARRLESVRDQLAAIVWPLNGEGPEVTQYDEVEVLEMDLEGLREKAEEDLELIQLGMAVAVINHEFQASINAIRRGLSRIKGWADANPGLRAPYRELRSSFEHLDGYLRLFTPLNRRLYRTQVDIRGAEIGKFLRDVFEKRLESAEARIELTPSFVAAHILQYPSTLYPVFLNLVDNALYWLSDYRGKRIITLDAVEDALVVRDSGPGVPERDRPAIFDAGFSRKPGGSGYGLFISRQVLAREGWTLELSPSQPGAGAEFVLRPGSN